MRAKNHFTPDRGGASATDGLARCVACASIASTACRVCSEPVCDTVCLQAHQIDHPRFAIAGPIAPPSA